MATPTTLLELATQKQVDAKATQTSAQLALAKAETDFAQARQDYAKAVTELVDLEKKVAGIREALAKVPTRADGEALLRDLEQNTIELRAKQAELLSLEQKQAGLESVRKQANGDLTAASAALKQAEAARAEAGKQDERGKEMKDALARSPLATLKSDANDALNTPPKNKVFTDADKRLKADIPAELLARATERRSQATKPLSHLDQLLQTAEGLSIKKLAARFHDAAADLEGHVAHAKERFDRALALLAKVANLENSPLTAEQKTRITDSELVDKGKAAAAKEKDRDDRRADLDAKQAALDEAILKVKSADIDADPNDDAAVKAATTARDKAQDDLNAAAALHTPALRKDLDTWEAAVPDSTWRLLDDFEEARALLTALKDTDPTALVARLGTAESDWVTSLLTHDKQERTAQFLGSQSVAYAAAVAFEHNVVQRRKFGALRGDN